MDEDEVSNYVDFELDLMEIKIKGVPARFRGTRAQGMGISIRNVTYLNGLSDGWWL